MFRFSRRKARGCKFSSHLLAEFDGRFLGVMFVQCPAASSTAAEWLVFRGVFPLSSALGCRSSDAGEALAATLSEKNPKNVFQFVAMISRKWAYSLDI